MKKILLLALLVASVAVHAAPRDVWAHKRAELTALGLTESQFGPYMRVRHSRGGRSAVVVLGKQNAQAIIVQRIRAGQSAEALSAQMDSAYTATARVRREQGIAQVQAENRARSRAKSDALIAPCLTNPNGNAANGTPCSDLRGYSRSKWLEAKMRKEREPITEKNNDQDEKIKQLQGGINTADQALERADRAQDAALAAQQTANTNANTISANDDISNGVRLRAIARHYGNHHSTARQTSNHGAQVILTQNGGQVTVKGKDNRWGTVYSGPIFIGGKYFVADFEGDHHTQIYVNLEDNIFRYESCRNGCYDGSVGGSNFRIK